MIPDKDAFYSYFSTRGIKPETVAANGIRLSPPDETYRAVGVLLPAIRWDYGGGYYRYRFLGNPDLFPKDEKGKPVKAKAPKGSGNRLYIPRHPGQTAEALEQQKLNPAIPLMIVEGEADCLGVLQVEPDALVVGISGCWGWKSKENPILPELRELAKPGRVAVLCPDSDWKYNPKVFQAWLALGTRLKQLECQVQVIPIESSPDNKLGAGDFVHQFGAEAWHNLPRILLSQWETLGNEIHHKPEETEENSTRKKPVAKLLIELALELGFLWHDSTGAGWIDFTVDGNLQTARIRSKRFRDCLARVLWEREERSINSEAWSEAVGTLEGIARFKGPEREAFLRVGKHGDCIYIDLGTDDWRIIRVSPSGWEVIPYSKCPIRFYRADCQLPLPTPTRGGSLDDLWQLLNVKEADRPLVVGWLLSCLTPDGSKPILTFSGEKGSGKSSAATLLKRLTDPTRVSKASGVGDARTVASAAVGRWVLCFDNLTHLSPEQQDLLCCVSTGAGYSHRTLYTDLEESFLEYRRPQILTGIDLVPTRSDLLDRCLIVRLERISEESRLTEEELEVLTADLLPGIYGALLDLLVVALRNLPETQPIRLPRMADFARLGLAAKIPNFMETYASNIEVGSQAAVEANPLAAGILALLDTCNGYWHGTTTELIRKLQELDPTSKDFQKLSARSVGRKLASCLKGDLAAVGVEVDQGKSTNGQRYLILSRVVEFEKTMPPQTPTLDPAPSLNGNPVEKQSPPIALHDTPVQNNGATAVSSTPSSTSAPVKPEVAALQSDNGRIHATEGRVTVSSPPTSNTAREGDSHTSRWQWDSLLDAYGRAGVPHWRFRDVVSEAAGISKKDVGNISLSQEQYQRAMAYLANYQNGATASAPARPEEKKTPVAVSSPPTTSNPHNSDSAEIGLPLAHEGIPPWLWEG
jgi:hypothetical protein